ncbi:hypothetical protein [Micromonospora sp. L32]|uniref:hypothetical protein n=1 Tax=Micromonospora sp. L32 TaxID=3452214 RepID=UPI003F8CED61
MTMKHRQRVPGLRRLVSATVAALTLTLAAAPNAMAAPATPQEETLQWVSAEDYLAMTGASPDRGKLDNGAVSKPLPEEGVAPDGTPASLRPRLDPGGGNDGKWWSVVWSGRDRNGTYVPLRLGNSDLGYLHYNVRHNLVSLEPWKAALNSHGPNAQGNYVALLVDRNLGVRETVIFGVQLSTRTQDGRYTSPDGAYIGVITGYCKGKNKCPDAVNRVKVS